MVNYFEDLFEKEFNGKPAKLLGLETELKSYLEHLTVAQAKANARAALDKEGGCSARRVDSPDYFRLIKAVGEWIAVAQRARHAEMVHFATPPKRFLRRFGL